MGICIYISTIMTKETYITGLTDHEVTALRQQYGWNILTPPKKQSLWKLYLEKYQDPIIQILLVAASVSLILAIIEKQYIETIGIFIAIFLATTVGFLFERDAAKKFDVLTQLNEEQKVKVIRNGQVQLIPRKELVVGDQVIIETGDEIPADGVLEECTSLQVDESMLTGEPITSKECTDEEKTSEEAYAKNYVMRSTMVMNGRGRFVVTAIGDNTEIGKVAKKSSENTDVKTPLSLQLDRLGKLISKFGLSLSILSALLFLGHDILVNDIWKTIGEPGANYLMMLTIVLKYLMMAVSLIAMAVPEGLPMAVTLSLALNMRRMLKSQNLVRKLHACETMGAVTVICTDKTGTLTQNKMQVGAEYRPYYNYTCASDNYNYTIASENYNTNATDYKEEKGSFGISKCLAEAIAVNTTAHLDGEKGIGNPTEVSLLLWLKSQHQDYLKIRQGTEIVEQIPFSTETKQMVTTVRRKDGNFVTYLKGAPEIVLAQCNMTEEERLKAEEILKKYQSKAMRTLALACKEDNKNSNAIKQDETERAKNVGENIDNKKLFTLQAIFGISDPIRPDVAGAVRQCDDAGIKIKIVTGDVDITAREIARQIGIEPQEEENGKRWSISGAEFSKLSDEEAYEVAQDIHVMSRARPTDKQRLVQMLQKHGETVAVTGDGTNDAPALNYAHVGLSLGSGTNVAKEASDMTLLDDSFASIVNAVLWGRSLYRNIQRFLYFQLVVNVVALLLVISGSLVGTEMPLTITQILWVNLIMDTFAALALASLSPSREVMKEKPRKQTDFILSKNIIRGIVATGLGMFFVMFLFLLHCEGVITFGWEEYTDRGIDPRELTWFFTTFVMLQLWNLFNAKAVNSHHSAFRRLYAEKGMLFIVACILVGQWMIVTFGGEMFRCVPMSWKEWAIIILATSPVLWIGEIYRYVKYK